MPSLGLFVVTADGKVLDSWDLTAAARYVGFCTPSIGYAIVIVDCGTGAELLRTSDGGASWKKLALP